MIEEGRDGSALSLRAFEPEDWELLVARRRSGRHLLHEPDRLPLSRFEAQDLAADASRSSPTDRVELVLQTDAGLAVGTASVVAADPRNGVVGLAAWVADAYLDHVDIGPAIVTLVTLVFDDLGYRRAEIELPEGDASGRAAAEALGFEVEGRRRRALWADGDHHDVVLLGLLRAERGGRDA
ncbi:MAG TPA: GNAT family protein [Iamia sp.]|nr:GNAT family protein [Iamia sp.]